MNNLFFLIRTINKEAGTKPLLHGLRSGAYLRQQLSFHSLRHLFGHRHLVKHILRRQNQTPPPGWGFEETSNSNYALTRLNPVMWRWESTPTTNCLQSNRSTNWATGPLTLTYLVISLLVYSLLRNLDVPHASLSCKVISKFCLEVFLFLSTVSHLHGFKQNFVAGSGLEPETWWLWAIRATTAPSRIVSVT